MKLPGTENSPSGVQARCFDKVGYFNFLQKRSGSSLRSFQKPESLVPADSSRASDNVIFCNGILNNQCLMRSFLFKRLLPTIPAAYSMVSSASKSKGFTRASLRRQAQCKWGPVTRPVAPTSPMTWPDFTISFAWTRSFEQCP